MAILNLVIVKFPIIIFVKSFNNKITLHTTLHVSMITKWQYGMSWFLYITQQYQLLKKFFFNFCFPESPCFGVSTKLYF